MKSQITKINNAFAACYQAKNKKDFATANLAFAWLLEEACRFGVESPVQVSLFIKEYPYIDQHPGFQDATYNLQGAAIRTSQTIRNFPANNYWRIANYYDLLGLRNKVTGDILHIPVPLLEEDVLNRVYVEYILDRGTFDGDIKRNKLVFSPNLNLVNLEEFIVSSINCLKNWEEVFDENTSGERLLELKSIAGEYVAKNPCYSLLCIEEPRLLVGK